MFGEEPREQDRILDALNLQSSCIEKLPDGQDRDAFVRVQTQEMAVATDDNIGVALDGAFEYAVIIGVVCDDLKNKIRFRPIGDSFQSGADDSRVVVPNCKLAA